MFRFPFSSWINPRLLRALIIFQCILILQVYFPLNVSQSEVEKPFNILLWGKFYHWDHAWMNNITQVHCKSEFNFTSDQSQINNVDVLFFHFHFNTWKCIPPKPIVAGRDPDIPWIFLVTESPVYYPFDTFFQARKDWDGVFNWSYSFYTDSEFYDIPVKSLYRKLGEPDKKWIYGSDFSLEFLRQKNKTAMWVVSNCGVVKSQRNELKDALVKLGINVDIYGRCGKPCKDDCILELGPQYRFYLAFENSLCLDYITEKIQNGLASGMIPVLFGMGNLSLHAPPNSYIDVMDFSSVDELAERLTFLERNPSEYFKYFEWRQHTEPPPLYIESPFTSVYNDTYGILFCDILRQVRERTFKVRKPGGEIFRNVYENMGNWYTNFYNDKFKKFCPRCLALRDVKIKKPSWLRSQILDNQSLCRG